MNLTDGVESINTDIYERILELDEIVLEDLPIIKLNDRPQENSNSFVEKIGDIDDKDIIDKVTHIMEGGREAFQYRSSLYNTHWRGGAYIVSEY